MTYLEVPPWEERSGFLISATMPLHVFSEFAAPPKEGRRSLPSPYSFIGHRLPFHLAMAYERSMNGECVDQSWRYSIVLEDGTQYLRVNQHEWGTEVNLVPLASFVATAIVSGVIGNLAYDLLKKLLIHARTALMETLEEWNRSGAGEILGAREMDHLCNLVEIRLITPDGNRIATFDPEKGLPKETVEYLTRKIEKYREQN